MTALKQNLASVQERIAAAAASVGRDPNEITIVAVTKTHPYEVVQEALDCGLRVFGENRVQEALLKFAPRDERPNEQVHLLGALQGNKARRASAFFDMIESLDRADIAQDLERHLAEANAAPLPALVEVNISGEAQKSGVAPQDLHAMADFLASCPHLAPRGLMTVAAYGASEADLRRSFAQLRELRDALAQRYPAADWRELSMGMSDDFEAAIREGATIIRLGRALFGSRQ